MSEVDNTSFKEDKINRVHVDVDELSSIDKDRSQGDVENYILAEERTRLVQGLKQRHIQMLTLVGVFGTGLFLSSGGTLAKTGPCGMLLSYIIVGVTVCMNQLCIAETSTLMPVTASAVRHAEHFMDDCIGFAYGWITVYSNILPGELSAAAVVITYWSDLNPAIFITIMAVVEIATNSYSIRFYGEVEFFFGVLKILLVVGLIICGLVIDLGGVPGQERLGFRYWRDPGPFAEHIKTGSLGKFLGFWSAINSVVYSYGGLQGIAMLSAEVQNPRRSIWRAAKRIMIRVVILYCVAVLILGMLVPYNDASIATGTGTASSSPFVIAIKRSGIKGLDHVINAVVLTSAFSAGNLGLVNCSRTLFALAVKGQAPRIFLKTNKRGVPWVGLYFSAAFLPLAYMSCSEEADTVFSWFQSITSSNLLLFWIIISANHIAMTRAMKVQGFSRDLLPYKTRYTPAFAWISGGFSLLLLLTSGYSNFISGEFVFSSFFTAYFTIPFFGVLAIGWKLFKRTKWTKSSEVDLATLFQDVQDHPEPPYDKLKGWKWIALLWS